ncbi:MAG: winged helix DNA-binding domain-containing protein, partial [Pseudonocardiaceae bacterium]
YQTSHHICTRVLLLLAADGRIVRGRPRGSWISSQYRWSPLRVWLPGGLANPPIEVAQQQLARQWLATFGPGTVADLQWWSGWSAGDTSRALTQLDVAKVDLDGTSGVVLTDDLEPVAAPEPWAALLPALDPTAMGWSDRRWFLGDHAPTLFDRTGNIGPTVWWDGQIVGGWAQRKTGEVVFRLLDDVGRDAITAVEAAAERLGQRLGMIRVTPRFRTPLERELSA